MSHDQDRKTAAAYLRELADHVEAGRVQGVFCVVTKPARQKRHIPGHVSLLGPLNDLEALKGLLFDAEVMRDQFKGVLLRWCDDGTQGQEPTREDDPEETPR